LITEMQNRASR